MAWELFLIAYVVTQDRKNAIKLFFQSTSQIKLFAGP